MADVGSILNLRVRLVTARVDAIGGNAVALLWDMPQRARRHLRSIVATTTYN
ncbi:predicted protein [Pyrenophora tritici-repentis Pt-1C-BFP]|uniref:Uncharacterized protein n=1 Tax=Pyrenophora tritici-repentis (strain Pt-1C-BFP) TaxID=426418 RepID=B2VWJ8_PYRTR|nr:uncharacterized protein PTRG_01560 [Pyrenophora tritici-repentis Pt-1C-BFP]EDU40998.1 predicted protein [Pyrenophora tritici-repentis Pt-1C-BFP]